MSKKSRNPERLLRTEALFIPPGSEELLAFEEWLFGLKGEELERYEQAVHNFCLQELGQTSQEVLDEGSAGMERGEGSDTLLAMDAYCHFTFAYWKAKKAARRRNGQ